MEAKKKKRRTSCQLTHSKLYTAVHSFYKVQSYIQLAVRLLPPVGQVTQHRLLELASRLDRKQGKKKGVNIGYRKNMRLDHMALASALI